MKAFVAVYEERSFTAAAVRENATQPGISQHIRQLETLLGVQLFDRTRSRVEPTPAAHVYYGRCIAILRLSAEAVQEVRQFRSELEGELRVGVSPVLVRAALTPAVAAFVEEHPNVALRVIESYPDPLTAMVLAEELDFAVIPTPACRAGLRATPFVSAPEVLVSSASSRFRHLRPLPLREAGPLKLALPSSHYVRRQTLDAYFAAVGVDVVGVIEMDSVSGCLELAASSDWSTVLPSLTIASEVSLSRFSVNKLIEPEIVTQFSLIEPSRLGMTAAAAAFSSALLSSSLTLVVDFDVEPDLRQQAY